MRTPLATPVLLGLLVGAISCAHAPAHDTLSPAALDARLLTLESRFVAFTGTDLTDEVRPVAALEAAVGELQRVRLRYLALLDRGANERQTRLIMTRIAELHLDLAARGRRLPYPAELSAEGQAEFDAQLGRIAAPLEAAGLGVLEQVAGGPASEALVRRAQLYLSLHRDGRVTSAAAEQLREELADEGAFAAPKRLLEIGRVGRRASRR